MKVSEFKEMAKDVAKDKEVNIYDDKKMVVKRFIPLKKKIAIAKSVAYGSIVEEGDVMAVQSLLGDVLKEVYIVDNYTDISLPSDPFLAHDLITKTGVYELAIEHIDNREIKTLEKMVDRLYEDLKFNIMYDNKLSKVIGGFFNQISKNIPNVEEFKKALEEWQKAEQKDEE